MEISKSIGNGRGKCSICFKHIGKGEPQFVVHAGGYGDRVHAKCLEDSIIKARLDYLRKEILAERISYAEIAELQDLAKHIEKGDVLLLQWAGIKEHDDE